MCFGEVIIIISYNKFKDLFKDHEKQEYEFTDNYPINIYVVINDNDILVDSYDFIKQSKTYGIYIMSENVLQEVHLSNKLSTDMKNKIISASIKAGYLITIPIDMTTVPYFLLLAPFAKGFIGGPGR